MAVQETAVALLSPETFIIIVTIFGLGGTILWLWYAHREHRMDDLDCAKYEVFNDPDVRPEDIPAAPASCRPGYVKKRAFEKPLNMEWYWIALGIGIIWAVIIVIGFVLSHTGP